jgi:hypothetical protein
MREVAISSRKTPATLLAVLLVAAAPEFGAPAPTLGPAGRLCDQPTTCTSRPDRLELTCEWPPNVTDTKKFFVIVPPGRALVPEALEAKTDQILPSSTSSTKEVPSDPIKWLNTHPSDRSKVFESEAIAYLRHYRVVEIRVTPYFQSSGGSYRIRRLRWAYRWNPPYRPAGGFHDEACRRRDQGFGAILSRVVVNPDACGIYADPNPPQGDLPGPLEGLTFKPLAGGKRPLLRLDVDEKALYRLDTRSLVSTPTAALPQMDHLQLYHHGQPVPLYLHRDTSRAQRPAELIFYGVPSDSKYTRTNCYWLTEDRSREPVRMAEAPVAPEWRRFPPETSFPEALAIEQDNDLIIHADNFLTISEFQWVWGEIPPTDRPASATAMVRRGPEGKAWFTSATFSLPGLVETTSQTQFDVSFYFGAPHLSQPARVLVQINTGVPQEFALQGPENLVNQFSMPNGQLRETANTITVRFAPGAVPQGESIYFDRLVAHYRRRCEMPEHGFTFSGDPPTSAGWRHYAVRGKIPPRPLVLDVADSAHPRVMQSERDADGALHFGQKEKQPALYRVLSLDEVSSPTIQQTANLVDVSSQTTPIDYLIIAHRDFIDLLDPLAASLRDSGWRVRVVDVQSVYDSFSWGESGPIAIKAFLAHTLRHWAGGGPAYVLLVGDCTSDYRGDFRNNVKNFVPTYTLERAPGSEKWASEHWFTTIAGSDEYSDVILSRLSVNSRKDAKTVIDKVVRYRNQPLFDPWRMRLTYVADEGASFKADAEELRERYRAPALVGQAIYLEDLPWEDNYYLPPELVETDRAKVSPVTTTRILDMFNRGASFVSYNGHGSPNIWSNDRIWFGGDSPNSDILLMRNGERLPFIVNLTCNSGAIDYPEPPWNLCISEDFMRCTSGGAIALYVPSGPGIPTSHMRLSEELHDVLFYEGVRNIGDIVFLTKYRYLLKRQPLEMIHMFLLLGEPACRLQMPVQTFPLTVDQTVLSTSGGLIRVSGRSDLGSDQKAVLALFSAREEERFSMPLEVAADGRFEQTVTIPPTEENTSWTLRSYCWSEAAKRDAVGWASLKQVQPALSLTRFENETRARPLRAGDPTTFSCTLVNRGLLPAAGIPIRVYRIAQDRRFLIDEVKVTLAAGQEQTVRVPWKAEAGFFRFEALLPGPPELIGRPAPTDQRKTLDLAVVGAGVPRPLEISPVPVTTEISSANDHFLRRNVLLVGCVGTSPVRNVSAALADETTRTESQPVGTLAPGDVRAVAFQRTIEKDALSREYRITVRYLDESSSRIVSFERTEPVRPSDFSDLTILRDQISFLDEANAIIYRDFRPTDGHTVYIDVPVKNIGGAPTDRPFGVEVFEGNPAAGGKPLRSEYEFSSRKEIPFLDGGQVRTMRFRWDSIHNAGMQTLYFRVDGDQKITDSNRANNETSRTLKVLTKGKLVTGDMDVIIPTFEQARAGLRPLGATFMNVGETTLTQVLVEYYIGRKQTPPNKIGEALVDKVGPNKKVEVIYPWKPTPEQLRRVREKFSFMVRQKGSTQRVIQMPAP